jgi:hypothetical protein
MAAGRASFESARRRKPYRRSGVWVLDGSNERLDHGNVSDESRRQREGHRSVAISILEDILLSWNRKCSRSICFAYPFRKTGIYFSRKCSRYDPRAAPRLHKPSHRHRLGTHGLARQRFGKCFRLACRSRPAHIIKFRPIGVESVAEGALQLANRAREILQHDTSPSRLRRRFCRPPPLIGRIDEGPGSKRRPHLNFDGNSLKIGANGRIGDLVARRFSQPLQRPAGQRLRASGIRLTLLRLVFT